MRTQKSLKTDEQAVHFSGGIIKVYAWTNFVLLTLMILLVFLSMSKLLGIALFMALILVTRLLLKNASDATSILHSSKQIPLMLTMLPILLIALQFTIAKPLTAWSRSRAIHNSTEIIGELQRYQRQYHRYPMTLNATWKDYETGIVGVEKYHYSYDDTTYNLFFEQPRFLFDRFGTREFVVYNPKDNHVILSHASWHLLLGPDRSRQIQGWYSSVGTGEPHWKAFLFD